MKPYDPTQLPPERFPRIPPEQYTEDQKKVAAAITAGPRGEVRGPFNTLIRSPGLANTVQQVGEYLRYKCPVDRRLAEMVTLIAARHWSQNYEFNAHYEHAMKAGLKPAIAEAIAQGRRPTGMAEDEEIAYELVTEGLQNKCVCDVTFERAKAKFGEQIVIDMLAIAGYYAMVAMILNVSRTRLPGGKPLPLTPYPY